MFKGFNERALSVEHWQNVVVEAIDALPTDIAASVGWFIQDDRSVVVTVAVESMDDESESEQQKIVVSYWPTFREYGWPIAHNNLYIAGGSCADQTELPVIHVETAPGVGDGLDSCMFMNHLTVGGLQRVVQVAILETMYSGGAFSLVAKDEDGRFVRDDDSLVLEWQTEWQSEWSYDSDDIGDV